MLEISSEGKKGLRDQLTAKKWKADVNIQIIIIIEEE